MANGFLEVSDGRLLAWSLSFMSQIQSKYAEFGLSAADAAGYGVLHAAFSAAMHANTCGNRSKVTTLNKNEARAALLKDARLLVSKIKGDKRVTDTQKYGLGLPVKAPRAAGGFVQTAPFLAVWDVNRTTVTLVLQHGESGRRKAPGAVGATVFYALGDTPPSHTRDWLFCGNFGRNIIDVTFDEMLPAGTKVWLTAEWMNGRFEPGPRAAGAYTHLQGGGLAIPVRRPAFAGRAMARAA